MSVLRAGNTTLEDGKVRICVSIAYETENEILEESVRIGKSSVADIAEWRIVSAKKEKCACKKNS